MQEPHFLKLHKGTPQSKDHNLVLIDMVYLSDPLNSHASNSILKLIGA